MSGESNAVACSPHWAAVATALNAVQTSRYPARKRPVGTSGSARSRRFRFAAAIIRMSGEADGTIIATIMTAHMTNRSARSTNPHACIRGMARSALMSMPAIPRAK